jgi:hypothetical protein
MGGLKNYQIFIHTIDWYDKELLAWRPNEHQHTACSQTPHHLKVCTFDRVEDLFTNKNKHVWVNWDKLLIHTENCANSSCLIPEELANIAVYQNSVNSINLTCKSKHCLIASSETIASSGIISTYGDLTIIARGNIEINSIEIAKNNNALLISTQGMVTINQTTNYNNITIISQVASDDETSRQLELTPLRQGFHTDLEIIQGIKYITSP